MSYLRILVPALFLSIAVYTVIVVANHGTNLVPAYFADVFSLTWTGQFVADFTSYLVLSALWVAWRHDFSAAGIGLAALALVGGMLFFALYLLFAMQQAGGDPVKLLVGPQRSKS